MDRGRSVHGTGISHQHHAWDKGRVHCSGLTNVTIGSGVTNILGNAFWACTEIRNVTLSQSALALEMRKVFPSAYASITNVTISTDVTCIPENAFYGCAGLADITIPEGVTDIGDRAFYNCTGLTSRAIPDSVAAICFFVSGEAPHSCPEASATSRRLKRRGEARRRSFDLSSPLQAILCSFDLQAVRRRGGSRGEAVSQTRRGFVVARKRKPLCETKCRQLQGL